MDIEEQICAFRSKPPESLRGLVCEPAELPDYPFDGHGGEHIDVVFRLECKCRCSEVRSQGSDGMPHAGGAVASRYLDVVGASGHASAVVNRDRSR